METAVNIMLLSIQCEALEESDWSNLLLQQYQITTTLPDVRDQVLKHQL